MNWEEDFSDLLAINIDIHSNAADTLCCIDYEEDYKTAIKLLDMVLSNNEFSARVLRLTDYIVNHCEGHYTAWSLRRRCLSTLYELESEMKWILQYTMDCPKNYQLWQHRMHIFKAVMQLHEGDKSCRVAEELVEVEEELARNPKNYHAWQYRQWIIQEHSVNTETELRLCIQTLKEDPFNNSVYNHLVFMHYSLHLPKEELWTRIEPLDLPDNDSMMAFRQWLSIKD